ncbi:retrotransposon protein, putative, ty1-copia subclass, partial [Tanacetum coccineum]
MGKSILELHDMLKLHEKGISKKAETPAGLRGSRKLKHGSLSMYMGNGMRAVVKAIGSFDLVLPSGLINVLDNSSRNRTLQEASGSDVGLELLQEEDDTQPSENTSEQHDELHELGDLNEPPNYKVALSVLESDKWVEAMNAKIQSMKDNQVWCLVDLPPNGQLVDYEETFLNVANIRAIRILLAIVAYYDYDIWQMDVKTAFLNGHLSEDVYMVQPEGVEDPKRPKKVCKLQQSIYGLKQASKSRNKRFDEEKKVFTQNPDEPCVYLKSNGSNVAFLVLYVYDMLIMGNNIPMLPDVESWLGKCFIMQDLGEAAYILGIKITRDRSKRLIALSQSAYFDIILKKFKMENSKR